MAVLKISEISSQNWNWSILLKPYHFEIRINTSASVAYTVWTEKIHEEIGGQPQTYTWGNWPMIINMEGLTFGRFGQSVHQKSHEEKPVDNPYRESKTFVILSVISKRLACITDF